MLHDRSAMAQFGDQADFFSQWAVRKFAGEDLGTPIDWDPSPPLHSDAEHVRAADGDNAAILVEAVYTEGPKQGQPRSFEELWAGAVFELHNVVYAREFVRLNDEADDGKVSKEAFVAGILKYELRAAQQTRAFYLQVFLPWAEKKALPTDPSLWFGDWWETPDTVLKGFTDKSSLSVESLRADVRLGRRTPSLASKPVPQGLASAGANARRERLRGGSGRRAILDRALPDSVEQTHRSNRRL